MKILFFGNQGNTGYRIVSWLRARGIDASLFFPPNIYDTRSLPEWEDPALKNHYPEWMVTYRHQPLHYLYPPRRAHKIIEDRDLVLTTGSSIIPALTFRKPVIFIPVGGDITQLPFRCSPLYCEPISFLYRKRFQNVHRVFTAQEDCVWAARFLEVSHKVIRFSLPVDINAITTNRDDEFFEQISHRFRKYDLVLFNPSRKNLDPSTVDYKGTEKFLKALTVFCSKKTPLNVRIIFGMHGHHSARFRNMVHEYGLDPLCDFVEHLPLPRLHAYLSLGNVVTVDEFGRISRISIGGISREALALGSLLITATDTGRKEFISVYGPDCPLFPALDANDILDALEKISSLEKSEIKKIQQESKKWAWNYLHWENRIDRFIQTLESLI